MRYYWHHWIGCFSKSKPLPETWSVHAICLHRKLLSPSPSLALSTWIDVPVNLSSGNPHVKLQLFFSKFRETKRPFLTTGNISLSNPFSVAMLVGSQECSSDPISLWHAPGLSSSSSSIRQWTAADDVGTLSKTGYKESNKKTSCFPQGPCMFSTYSFYLDKAFLGIDFVETTRCQQGDALQWAPSLKTKVIHLQKV